MTTHAAIAERCDYCPADVMVIIAGHAACPAHVEAAQRDAERSAARPERVRAGLEGLSVEEQDALRRAGRAGGGA